MTEYAPLLRKAIADVDRTDEAGRYEVYERVRRALVRQLQTAGRTDAEMDQEIEALSRTVASIEDEIAGEGRPTPPQPIAAPPRPRDTASVETESFTTEPNSGRSLRTFGFVGVGVAVAAIAAGLIVYLASPRNRSPSPTPPRAEVATKAVAAPAAQAKSAPSEDNASYLLRRQRVFYRTTHPPGTIVVSLNQRFLYVVQPNQVAIRYAIAIGPACDNAVGLFRVTEKVARATPASTGTPDARFDPPALYFDKGRAVHEAKEPNRVGQSANAGCFQSWDQDIADLFERIQLNDRVVVAN